jgi:hypothetical protein
VRVPVKENAFVHTENRLNGEAHALARDKLSEIAADIAITPIEIMPETLRHAVPIVEEMVTAGVVERGDATDAVWRAMVASGFAAHKGEDAAQQLLADCINRTRKTPEATAPQKGPAAKDDRHPAPEGDPVYWNVEPWPEPVSGSALLDAICEVLSRYMVLPPYAAEAIALWALHAWTITAWEISPLLIIVSPTKQCGKSTLLTILFWILQRSELFANATASPIFRLIEDAKPAVPTFLFDEGDSYFKPDKEDLRGIINSGWMKATARVIRTEGDGNKRRGQRFSTWAAKVIATIKAVADTLMDRGVIVRMRRATKAEKRKVQRFLMRDTPEFADLRRKCLRWANDQIADPTNADPQIPDALANRPADN